MLIGIYQTVAISLVIVIFYAIDFVLIARYDRQRKSQGSGRSWDFTLMVLVMAAFLIVQPVAWPWMGIQVEAAWGVLIQLSGAVLIGSALVLNVWARIHLQHFYAERVEVQVDHQVVDTGPYAYVRHPVFTSFFAIVVGLILVNPALSSLLVAIYTFWDFGRAARQEEKLLSSRFPRYEEYMLRTGRFLPRLGR